MHTDISTDDLRRAASIKDEIERFEVELDAILEGSAPRRGRKPGSKGRATENSSTAPKKRRKKRKLSPEARARIVAAVKARWARVKGRK